MSLDLSAALQVAAELAPVGTLETGSIGRRIRRRRAQRTAAQSAVGVGLVGGLALTAVQAPDLLDRLGRPAPAGPAAPSGLPADEVASVLPAADPAAAAGACGWLVDAPAVEAGVDLTVALGSYEQQSYLALAVSLGVEVAEGALLQDPVDVVVAKDGVVVATAPDELFGFGVEDDPGPHSMEGGGVVTLASCGGPDATKALPDGDYTVYGVLASDAGAPVALSPGQPLVVAGNARAPWCGADVSVLPGSDDRLQVTGGVVMSTTADLSVAWYGDAQARYLGARIILVDGSTRRIVGDSDTWGAPASLTITGLEPGAFTGLTPTIRLTGCGDGARLPRATYSAYVVVTVAPSPADFGVPPADNVTTVVALDGPVRVD